MTNYNCTTKRCSFKHLNAYERGKIAAPPTELKN